MYLSYLWKILRYLLYVVSSDDVITAPPLDSSTIRVCRVCVPKTGRRFDGVGAISGGGATSKLLMAYKEPWRSDILDYLFLPQQGASLQILKVEMGGDAQSTEGTESSHMHNSWDENYNRGYEWWLMTEAKKRNPDIKLCTLAWGFPGWLGRNSWWPFLDYNQTSMYMIKWLQAAHEHHNVTIDYVGIWNEKPYDKSFIKHFRYQLDAHNLVDVQIIAADGIGEHAWNIVQDISRDPGLSDAVGVVGVHYTDGVSTELAQECNKPLWSSEDYSSSADDHGAGCIARLVNRNYVTGYMTSTLAWNMIGSYYDGLPISRHSLMLANQPWSGHYEVAPPVWAVAHTTHFTAPGWTYLHHNSGGVGFLSSNGSYVSLVSEDQQDLTIVIENINAESHAVCVRGPSYSTTPLNVTLDIHHSMSHVRQLHWWSSRITFGAESEYMVYKGVLDMTQGKVEIFVDEDSIHTLTTLPPPPTPSPSNTPLPPQPFPVPYEEDFDGTPLYHEADLFTQQIGSFEVQLSPDDPAGHVLQQMVLEAPIHWCPTLQHSPISILGDHRWTDIAVSCDMRIPEVNGTNGVFLAVHVDKGGCYVDLAQGLFLYLLVDKQSVVLAGDLARTKTFSEHPLKIVHNLWYSLELSIHGNHVIAKVNNHTLFSNAITQTSSSGFVGLGTDTFGYAMFDHYRIRFP